MRPTLSVVIPALNEAERLPRLLSLLAEQTVRPDAVIVADAGSTDTTRSVAEAAGATVVDGGRPAAGRNAGASVATTDLILFLDADDEPPPQWIELAVDEFVARQLFSAAGQVQPIETDTASEFACDVVNLYLQLMQYVVPHAPGCCTMVRREVHETIGGFDESLALAEDHEYVQRAAEQGKFRILRSCPMPTSMRRIEEEGLVELSFKYLYSELFVLTGRPMKEIPFEYEFAAFDRDAQSAVSVGIDRAREKLDGIIAPLGSLTARGIEHISQLLENASMLAEPRKLFAELTPGELGDLRHYVSARMEMTRRTRLLVVRRIQRAGENAWHRVVDEG